MCRSRCPCSGKCTILIQRCASCHLRVPYSCPFLPNARENHHVGRISTRPYSQESGRSEHQPLIGDQMHIEEQKQSLSRQPESTGGAKLFYHSSVVSNDKKRLNHDPEHRFSRIPAHWYLP